MKYIKTFESVIEKHRNENKDYSSLNINMDKFLIDFDYTFEIVKKINPKFENKLLSSDMWYEECRKEFTDAGFSDDDIDDWQWDYGSEVVQKIECECFERLAKYHTRRYMDYYNTHAKGKHINLSRDISIRDINEINWNNLGIYWSFDPDWVMDFGGGGKGNLNVRFYGTVHSKYVDWVRSLDNFIYFGEEENEVNIFKGSPILINKIEVNGDIKEVDKIFTT
jgi:hypothetical protein